MLAGEIERLDAVAGAEGLIAVGFQQVVEELHVELVVLHDQDVLAIPSLPLPRSPYSTPRRRHRRFEN